MYKEKALIFLYAETPLHPGSGGGVAYIDLPIQRESFTDFPLILPSELKGAIRDYFEISVPGDYQKIEETFGPSPEKGGEHAGAISLTEAKTLLFPIRSLYNVFAYITSPLVLNRFKRDLAMLGNNRFSYDIPTPSNDQEILIPENSLISKNGNAVFDEYAFSAKKEAIVTQMADFFQKTVFPDASEYSYFKENFPSRFCIVSDETYCDFTQMATEVLTRNRINKETHTVEEGMLWTEEDIPAETIFYSILLATTPFKEDSSRQLKSAQDVMNFLKENLNDQRFQVGGDQTLGRGVLFAHFMAQGER